MTNSEQQQFREAGFVKIGSFIPPQLLQKLQLLFDELMNFTDLEGKVMHENNGRQFITNIEQICRRGNLAALELLGYPPLLAIAKQICGDDYFMIQEFAVIKNAGDGMPVLWHLDMLHERKGNCFTVGIYLDPVDEGDGALKVVPGSHLSNKPICELSKEPHIEVPALAGDILIHDMMLAHCSDPMQKNKWRRVIYFEFLSATHVRIENIYDEELIERRTKLLPIAAAFYESQNAQKTDQLDNQELTIHKDVLEKLSIIYSEHIRARPSTYCFELNA